MCACVRASFGVSCVLTDLQELHEYYVRDALQCLLHSILFVRAPGSLRPREVSQSCSRCSSLPLLRQHCIYIYTHTYTHIISMCHMYMYVYIAGCVYSSVSLSFWYNMMRSFVKSNVFPLSFRPPVENENENEFCSLLLLVCNILPEVCERVCVYVYNCVYVCLLFPLIYPMCHPVALREFWAVLREVRSSRRRCCGEM